jgi:hypothetical protein
MLQKIWNIGWNKEGRFDYVVFLTSLWFKFTLNAPLILSRVGGVTNRRGTNWMIGFIDTLHNSEIQDITALLL